MCFRASSFQETLRLQLQEVKTVAAELLTGSQSFLYTIPLMLSPRTSLNTFFSFSITLFLFRFVFSPFLILTCNYLFFGLFFIFCLFVFILYWIIYLEQHFLTAFPGYGGLSLKL